MTWEERESLILLRQTLHAHPELSGMEVETAGRLQTLYHRAYRACDRRFWALVCSALSGGGDRPHIVLRADLDALPIDETIPLPYRSTNRGVSHKCGHDGHAAALAGVALELEREKPDCNVTLLFQPAEERGEGALECLDYFKACKADATYAFHNQPGQPLGAVVLFHDCYACASKGLAIHFTGTSAHACLSGGGVQSGGRDCGSHRGAATAERERTV